MIREFDRVMLTEDLPEYELKTGDIGAIVNFHGSRNDLNSAQKAVCTIQEIKLQSRQVCTNEDYCMN
jgi:hypothetical protein